VKSTLSYVQRVAVKAVILNTHGQVLILREASTDPENVKVGQFGLPGGRVEPGDDLGSTLLREVRDEAGLIVVRRELVDEGEWRPVIAGVPHQIFGFYYRCQLVDDDAEVRLSKEHDDYAWVLPSQRRDYPMMEPDGSVIDKVAVRT